MRAFRAVVRSIDPSVGSISTEADARAAYQRLVRKVHPDKVPAGRKDTAAEQFRRLQEAYERLQKPEPKSQQKPKKPKPKCQPKRKSKPQREKKAQEPDPDPDSDESDSDYETPPTAPGPSRVDFVTFSAPTQDRGRKKPEQYTKTQFAAELGEAYKTAGQTVKYMAVVDEKHRHHKLHKHASVLKSKAP